MLTPLGKACVRMDLTAVHEILLKTGYKDEEGAENEVSFFHFLIDSPKFVHGADVIEQEKDIIKIDRKSTRLNSSHI